MKRLLLMLAIASAATFTGVSHAQCAAAGQWFSGHIASPHLTIDATGWGNALGTVGPAQACSDATAGPAAQQASLVIRVDGIKVCEMSPADVRYGNDPFGFGAGFHGAKTAACWGDVSFDTITGVPGGDPGDFGQDGTGGHGGFRKSATPSGTFQLPGDEGPRDLPGDATGYLVYGLKITAN
jgi:hypothetical protein